MDRKKIPFSKDFYINTKGEVFDSNGSIRKTYLNGDNYVTVNIKLEDNRWVTFGVHRLVALTHIPRVDLNQTEINHRIPDLQNNNVSNLEWVTPSQNNIHSEIMRNNNFYITLYSTKDDIPVKTYINAHKAAEDNGCTALDVWDSVKDGVIFNGVRFHFQLHSQSLPIELRYDRRKNFTVNNRSGPRAIKMLDIYTGDILEFKSIGEAGKYFNVSPSHVYLSISKTLFPNVFLKKYQVAYVDKDFPIMSLEELNRAKNYGAKKVLAYNVDNNKSYIFQSGTEFYSTQSLSKKAVTKCLARNQLRKIGSWVALYLSEENAKRLKSYISGPADV